MGFVIRTENLYKKNYNNEDERTRWEFLQWEKLGVIFSVCSESEGRDGEAIIVI